MHFLNHKAPTVSHPVTFIAVPIPPASHQLYPPLVVVAHFGCCCRYEAVLSCTISLCSELQKDNSFSMLTVSSTIRVLHWFTSVLHRMVFRVQKPGFSTPCHCTLPSLVLPVCSGFFTLPRKQEASEKKFWIMRMKSQNLAYTRYLPESRLLS